MKILIFLLTISIALSADYKIALSYYANEEYQKSINELKASTSEYSNPKVHLLWAKSAEVLGKTTQAMNAYERVVMLDNNNTEAKLALFKIYKESSRTVLAKELKEELKDIQLTSEQKRSLELSIQIESLYKADATLSIGYDTNINMSANLSDLNEYYKVISSDNKRLSTLFAKFNGVVNYYNELDEKGGFYLKADLKLNYQNNFDASRFNIFVGTGELGIGYSKDLYSFYLPISYDRIHYLENDLLFQVGVKPKLRVRIDENFIMNVQAKYSMKKYNEKIYTMMDDSSIGLGLGGYYLFDKNFTYFFIDYDTFSASKTAHSSFINKDILALTLGIKYSFADWLSSKVEYRYKNISYEENREDKYNSIELKLSHSFKDDFEVFLSNRYIQNFSDYIPAKYNKNIAIFGISATY